MTFSGVASNFAGVPLALAFIFTIGRTGILTTFLVGLGFNPYEGGFSLYSKLGLEIVYFYFQLPLMILIIAPAIDGLKREWREASENMGASSFQFWRYVALPVLMPSLLGAMILLFGNAFGAQATAYQLTGGFINIVPLLIGSQLTGDVLHNVGLGYALAMGMIFILGITLVAYSFLQRRSERWLNDGPGRRQPRARRRRSDAAGADGFGLEGAPIRLRTGLVAGLHRRHRLLHPAAPRDAQLLAQVAAAALGLHRVPARTRSSTRRSATRSSSASSRSS